MEDDELSTRYKHAGFPVVHEIWYSLLTLTLAEPREGGYSLPPVNQNMPPDRKRSAFRTCTRIPPDAQVPSGILTRC